LALRQKTMHQTGDLSACADFRLVKQQNFSLMAVNVNR